jgi:hypothetical protein
MTARPIAAAAVVQLLLLAPLPAFCDAGQPSRQEWQQVGCGHVRAVGDVDPTRLSRVLDQVQRAVATLAGLLPSVDLTEPRIDVVMACDGVPIRRATFAPGRAVSVLVVPCDGTALEPDAVEAVLRHVLERTLDRPPLWLTAGAARYAAALRQAEGGAAEMWPTAADIVHLRKRPWLPIRTVLTATQASAEWTDASRRPRFVAQAAWYLALSARRPGVDLAAIVSGRDERGPEAAIVQVLGADLDTFAAEAERHFREEPTAKRSAAARGETSATTCQSPLSRGDATALHVRALVQLGRLDDARALAERGVTDDPRAASALAALATVRGAEGAQPEATALCQRAAENGPLSERDSYECAAVWLGPAAYGTALETVPADAAMTAMGLLSRLGADRPADAYYLEGVARLRTGDAGGAAKCALEGFARWPDRLFALLLARATDRRDGAGPLPVLRRMGPSERVVTGRLVGIDCDGAWVRLRVAVDAQVRSYALTRLEWLDIRTYGTAQRDAVRCGARAAPEIVRLTWRIESTAPADVEGIAAALEFLP